MALNVKEPSGLEVIQGKHIRSEALLFFFISPRAAADLFLAVSEL